MNRWEQFNAIINDESLSKDAKLLLLTIFRYINHETGYCTASVELLMKKARIGNRNTFSKARYELVLKGWIQYASAKGKGTKYIICNSTELHNSSEVNGSEVHNSMFSTGQLNSADLNYKKKYLKENKKENILLTKDNPYYDYIANGGWMYELSDDLILSNKLIH